MNTQQYATLQLAGLLTMRVRIALQLLIASLALTSCQDKLAPTQSEAIPAETMAPLAAARGEPVPDRYIVVFKPTVRDVPSEARRQVAAAGGRLHLTYGRVIKGYAATLSPAGLDAVRRAPFVNYVEQDQRVYGAGTQSPPPSWGLDRVDQRDLPLSNSYTYVPTGAGVRVYILDTGIRASHQDFGGRALSGQDFVGDGNGTNDCHGHGTHVAGTVGGTNYGVAKGATLVAVRVLGCDGSGFNSWIIAGVDWVTVNAQKPAVVNASLGGGYSPASNEAVTQSINSGVLYAIAAMNRNADACNFSPASTPAALTVAATGSMDDREVFSNWGLCVDLFAPGAGITSDYHTNDAASAVFTGTSMASPHVAGAAALYLQQNSWATPAQVAQALIGNATANKVTNPGEGTPNRLVYMGFLNGSLGTWTARASLPSTRRGIAVAAAIGILYAIGGTNSTGALVRTLHAYSTSTNSWTTRASMPVGRQSGNGAATVSGNIYVAGGQDAAGALTRTLYRYSASTNTWTARANMPTVGGCGGSAVITGKVYVFSGCTRSSTGAQVAAGLLHRYDPSTNAWTILRSAPAVHFHPVVGVMGGKLYVVGGNNHTVAINRLDVYDPATNSWSTKAAMPTARVGAAGVVAAGKLYVIGGRNGPTYLNAVESYDPVTNTWSTRTSIPTARSGLGVGVMNNLLYAIGGRNSVPALSINERFTP